MAFYVENDEPHFDEALIGYVKKGGSMAVLQSFLQNKNSNLVDSSGKTMLHYAAESNNVSMTQHCIDQKYNIDMLDYLGNSPVMLAVQNFCVETAKILIEAGANIYFRTYRGMSILPGRSDCKFGVGIVDESSELELVSKYQVLVKMILEKVRKDCWNDKKLLVSRLRYIDCSLVKAMYLEDANVTRLMLEGGYSVNEIEEHTGETALHVAVNLGDYENIKVLLEFDANVHTLDNDIKLSPIYYYDKSSKDRDQKLKILKLLMEHGALLTRPEGRKTPSQSILSNGNLWAVNALIQYDSELDPYDTLFYLVFNDNPDVLEAVRGKKIANVDSIDNPTKLPVLSGAVTFGKLQKVEFLLEYGANPNFVDENGWTPLMRIFRFSIEKEHLPIVRLLLQFGADAQYISQDGLNIFDLAIQSNYTSILEPIIAHLAMKESLGETIIDLIRSKINSLDKLKIHYKKCKQQLKRMKNVVVYESVTLYKLLTESQSKIMGYARNQELVTKFNESLEIELPLDLYYSISLRKRVGKAIHLTKLKEEAVIVLSKIIENSVRNYLDILSKIVDYFTCDDLKNICKVYELQESDSYNSDTLFT